MKFKGVPDLVVQIRIKRQGKWIIKPIFRFDKNGNAEFNTKGLSKVDENKLIRLYGVKEEVIEVVKETKKLSYKELQQLYTEKTGKKSFGIKKDDILKELEV